MLKTLEVSQNVFFVFCEFWAPKKRYKNAAVVPKLDLGPLDVFVFFVFRGSEITETTICIVICVIKLVPGLRVPRIL